VSEPTYRYRVLSAWGTVSDQLQPMIDKSDAFLVYGEYLGIQKIETLVDLRTGKQTGGWSMRYAGRRPFGRDKAGGA
jgi:hypothetical protein